MKKKVISSFLMTAMGVSLVACSSNGSSAETAAIPRRRLRSRKAAAKRIRSQPMQRHRRTPRTVRMN